jgi:hypothetical protein
VRLSNPSYAPRRSCPGHRRAKIRFAGKTDDGGASSAVVVSANEDQSSFAGAGAGFPDNVTRNLTDWI